jgi:hypothetical protein
MLFETSAYRVDFLGPWTAQAIRVHFDPAEFRPPADRLGLIEETFQPRYWDSALLTPDGYTLMEANFSLFFGLAVQMYESTLVSDATPFDRFMEGDDSALTPDQLWGLLVFLNRGPGRNPLEVDAAIAGSAFPIGVGNCISCHGGPEFTDAGFTSLSADGDLELIELEEIPELVGGLLQVSDAEGLLDNGFSNIGVRPTSDDPGRGGTEGGFPLSFVSGADPPSPHCCLPGGAPCVAQCRIRSRWTALNTAAQRRAHGSLHNGARRRWNRRQFPRSPERLAMPTSRTWIATSRSSTWRTREDPLVEFLSAHRSAGAPEQALRPPQLFVPDGDIRRWATRIEVPAGAGGSARLPRSGLAPLRSNQRSPT